MGIIGTLWLIILVLKVVGVVGTSWLLVLFWPVLAWLVLVLLGLFGIGLGAGISSLGSRGKRRF